MSSRARRRPGEAARVLSLRPAPVAVLAVLVPPTDRPVTVRAEVYEHPIGLDLPESWFPGAQRIHVGDGRWLVVSGDSAGEPLTITPPPSLGGHAGPIPSGSG